MGGIVGPHALRQASPLHPFQAFEFVVNLCKMSQAVSPVSSHVQQVFSERENAGPSLTRDSLTQERWNIVRISILQPGISLFDIRQVEAGLFRQAALGCLYAGVDLDGRMRHFGGSDPLECANLADHAAGFFGNGVAFEAFLDARGNGVRRGGARAFGLGADVLVDTVGSGGVVGNLQR